LQEKTQEHFAGLVVQKNLSKRVPGNALESHWDEVTFGEVAGKDYTDLYLSYFGFDPTFDPVYFRYKDLTILDVRFIYEFNETIHNRFI